MTHLVKQKHMFSLFDDIKIATTGLSHPFLGMGPGPLELGKIASF